MSSATVRVRIAVGVDQKGRWTAAGWMDATDSDMLEEASFAFDPDKDLPRYSWIEAHIPLPEPVALVEGEVSE